MIRVLQCLLVVAASVIAISVGGADPASAHRDGCHAQHSCPSDSGSYVCGDTGNYSECPGMGGTVILSTAAPSYGSTLNGGVRWDAHPTSATYQWTRGGQPIPGAVTPSYAVGGDDLGQVLALTATGTDGRNQTATAISSPVAVPALAGQATLNQVTATVGTVLSARTAWNAPVSETYQWFRGGIPIVGATSATYTATPADLGQPVAVTIAGAVASSSATTQAGPITPTAVVRLKLTGPRSKLSAGRSIAVTGVAQSAAPVTGLPVTLRVLRRYRGAWKPVRTRTVAVGANGTFSLKVRIGRKQTGAWKARASLSPPAGYSAVDASRTFRAR